MTTKQHLKIFSHGLLAVTTLLLLYFAVVSTISGWEFANAQLEQYGYYLGSLVLGFGIQVMLYSYLRELVRNTQVAMGGKTVAVTGTTSTLVMISCCAHYLVNIVPALGIAGVVTIIAQYQVKIFWVGIAFNLVGILFIVRRIMAFKKHAYATK